MKITLELPDYTEHSLSAEIIGAAASEIAKMTKEQLHTAIETEVRSQVSSVTKEHIAAAVSEILHSGFQKTNEYGYPSGDPRTVKEMVLEALKPHPNYGNREHGIPAIVSDVVKKEFDKEVKDATLRLRESMNEAIKSRITESFAAALGVKA